MMMLVSVKSFSHHHHHHHHNHPHQHRRRFLYWLLQIYSCLFLIPQLICCGLGDKSKATLRLAVRNPNDAAFPQSSFALLSGTLKTYQKASCHQEEWMSLRCPTGTTISVQTAQYGKNSRPPAICRELLTGNRRRAAQDNNNNNNITSSHGDLAESSSNNNSISCHWPTAIQYSLLQNVVGHCQKKTSCKFQTSPRTFGGDRCPGIPKYVEVDFKCRPDFFFSVIGCEDEVIQLKCNRSSRLAIYSAKYGRTEYESVTCPQPNGVSEETCHSSFATETVMQMCHGKRKCALNADQATFGTPCRPESRMYLKVIHTCVPRKVLLEKYQGDADPDEIFEEETEDDFGADSSVIEQPSIYSPDHSKGWPHSKNSSSSGRNSLGQFSDDEEERSQEGEEDVDTDGHNGTSNEIVKTSSSVVTHDSHTGNSSSINNDSTDQTYSSQTGVRIVYLVSQGINAYEYITKNSEKFYLYLAISTASVLLILILLILVKIAFQRRRRNGRNGNNHQGSANGGGGKASSSAAGPILSSGLSDIDDLSLDLEQNDMTFTEVPSILKRSSPYDREHSVRELRPLSTVTMGGGGGNGSGTATTTLGRSNEVVRFSNTLGRRDRDTNNPKSLKQESDTNEEFFYG